MDIIYAIIIYPYGYIFSITLFIACVIGKIHHYMLEKSQVVHQEKVYIVRSLLTVHLRG